MITIIMYIVEEYCLLQFINMLSIGLIVSA